MYASKTRKENLPGTGENCQRNLTDLAGSLVKSSRPPGRQQKRPDDQISNAGVAVQTADGSRRTANAGDEQCLRCGCSSPSCTVVLCAADIDICSRTDTQDSAPLYRERILISSCNFWLGTDSRLNQMSVCNVCGCEKKLRRSLDGYDSAGRRTHDLLPVSSVH